jgi:transposase
MLTYRATVDALARFRKSKAVGAVFGLTCAKYQSGEIDRSDRISRCGDQMMRVMLYEAAQSMLMRSTRWSRLHSLIHLFVYAAWPAFAAARGIFVHCLSVVTFN